MQYFIFRKCFHSSFDSPFARLPRHIVCILTLFDTDIYIHICRGCLNDRVLFCHRVNRTLKLSATSICINKYRCQQRQQSCHVCRTKSASHSVALIGYTASSSFYTQGHASRISKGNKTRAVQYNKDGISRNNNSDGLINQSNHSSTKTRQPRNQTNQNPQRRRTSPRIRLLDWVGGWIGLD